MGVSGSWESVLPEPCWHHWSFWLLILLTVLIATIKEIDEPSINWESAKNYFGLFMMCGIVYFMIYYIAGMFFNTFIGKK